MLSWHEKYAIKQCGYICMKPDVKGLKKIELDFEPGSLVVE